MFDILSSKVPRAQGYLGHMVIWPDIPKFMQKAAEIVEQDLRRKSGTDNRVWNRYSNFKRLSLIVFISQKNHAHNDVKNPTQPSKLPLSPFLPYYFFSPSLPSQKQGGYWALENLPTSATPGAPPPPCLFLTFPSKKWPGLPTQWSSFSRAKDIWQWPHPGNPGNPTVPVVNNKAHYPDP